MAPKGEAAAFDGAAEKGEAGDVCCAGSAAPCAKTLEGVACGVDAGAAEKGDVFSAAVFANSAPAAAKGLIGNAGAIEGGI
jgi:hypothetical protein